MLCAFAGPTPGKSARTSGGAVLRFTAPSTALPAARAGPAATSADSRNQASARTNGLSGAPPRGCAVATELRLGHVRRAEARRHARVRRQQHAAVLADRAAVVAAAAVRLARARLRAVALLRRLLRAQARLDAHLVRGALVLDRSRLRIGAQI